MNNTISVVPMKKKKKVDASLTLAKFMKSNYDRRIRLVEKFGYSSTYELKKFLENRQKRSKSTNNLTTTK